MKRKGKDLTQSYDESPYTNKKLIKSKATTQKCHQKFDYTNIVDRLRTVSLSNYSYLICVVKGKNFRLPATVVQSK